MSDRSQTSFRWKEVAQAVHPWRLHGVTACRSTSTLAARLREAGQLFAPAVVVASRQTAGRGRGSNVWLSDRGTLTATFVWPVEEDTPPTQLPLVAGVAVRDAAAELLSGLPAAVQLKWPNDVLIDERKLAGLLCERVHGVDLIGVGLNVATSAQHLAAAIDHRRGGVRAATSLELSGRAVTRTDALAAVARHLWSALSVREPFGGLLRRYDRHHILVGRQVRVAVGEGRVAEGVCKGLDAAGRLLLDRAGQVERVISGHVEAW